MNLAFGIIILFGGLVIFGFLWLWAEFEHIKHKETKAMRQFKNAVDYMKNTQKRQK